jgi:hypothetical protein
MLAEAESLLADFPNQAGRVTMFDLDPHGRISGIRYWDPNSDENPF